MDNDLRIYREVTALTGSSGSGKSTVAKLLRDLGAYLVSADELSRQAVEKGTVALAELVAEFGQKTLLASGDLDRKFFGNEIFSDPLKRTKAEEIIHPRVKTLAIGALKLAIQDKKRPIIYDVPLFFEAGLDKLPFKGSIVVYAEDSICIERIMQRDSLSKQEAENRLNSQMSSKEKMKGSTYIVNNSSSIEDLEFAVSQLWVSIYK